MADLLELIHEISVAFGVSSNLRTLTPRLATAMSLHCSLIEVEAIYLDPAEQTAKILAHDPHARRSWRGERSPRFLHRQLGERVYWCGELEPVRASSGVVASQLKLAVGRAGLLTLSFETEIAVELGETNTEILVSCLRAHCHEMGCLDTMARRSRQVHRNNSVSEKPKQPTSTVETNTDKSVFQLPLLSEDDTEISVTGVRTIEDALVGCISAALQATHGRIYGDGGAAELLGLKPSTLQSKMRKLGIERTPFMT